MKYRLWLHYRMIRWVLTSKCPVCSRKGIHKMDCPLPQSGKDLV